MTTAALPADHGPGVLDAVSLASEIGHALVVESVRDTHLAWLNRLGGGSLHRGIATSVYAGVRAGFRATGWTADALATLPAVQRRERRLESAGGGRRLRSVVNGLIGDRLADDRPAWAHDLSVRRDGHDVSLQRDALAAAYPDATGRVAVFVHGWCEDESVWEHRADRLGPGYPATTAELGWSPVLVRANTGLDVRENGALLARVLDELAQAWPVPLERVALVGHSMGGLLARVATAVGAPSWTGLVSDVVTLGTPHLGAPLAHGVGVGSTHLARLPETAALARVLDWRSVGVHGLVEGLAHDVPALPHASYRLVSATLTSSPHHPVGAWLGDALVRQPSAYGRGGGAELFPDADVLHLPRTGHLALLNHARVHEALRDWLG